MRRRGFTLMEMLVVIAIIAILAGILIPVIGKARETATRNADKSRIQSLMTALEAYSHDHGDYPPSLLAAVGIPKTNPVNQGAEVLVATLTHYYEFTDEQLINTDEDKADKPLSQLTGSTFQSPELWELSDHFGNPFVYVHHRDYAQTASLGQMQDQDGVRSPIQPQKSEKTGEWQKGGMYQVWGFGPNGINEQGGGDDVCNW